MSHPRVAAIHPGGPAHGGSRRLQQTKSFDEASRNRVQIVIILLSQYGLHHRRIPAKDENDIQDLDT